MTVDQMWALKTGDLFSWYKSDKLRFVCLVTDCHIDSNECTQFCFYCADKNEFFTKSILSFLSDEYEIITV